MNTRAGEIKTFGIKLPRRQYKDRPAAYVVIQRENGDIATVKPGEHCFLPGGGSDPGEIPQETIVREAREELAWEILVGSKIGEAIQYFSSRGVDYKMHAVFYEAEFIRETGSLAENEPYWLSPSELENKFYHKCHEWAAKRVCTMPT